MAGLVHEGTAVKLPGAAPGGAVIVSLRARPEHVHVDHVDAAEAALLDRLFQQLKRAVAAVLLDDEQAGTGLIAGPHHRQAIAPAGGHGLLGHHVETGACGVGGLAGVQAAGGGQHDAVSLGVGQHCAQAGVALGTGLGHRSGQRAGVGVANVGQLTAFGMLGDGIEVVVGNSAATHEGKLDLAAGDGGTMVVHGNLSG